LVGRLVRKGQMGAPHCLFARHTVWRGCSNKRKSVTGRPNCRLDTIFRCTETVLVMFFAGVERGSGIWVRRRRPGTVVWVGGLKECGLEGRPGRFKRCWEESGLWRARENGCVFENGREVAGRRLWRLSLRTMGGNSGQSLPKATFQPW
jgi:hypothetical protein